MEPSQSAIIGSKIAQLAFANAESASQGKCAKYVRAAIQEALGITIQPTGIESAKDYGPWLVAHGYKVSTSKNTDAAVGSVVIFGGNDAHKHGHIQIKTGAGQWTSDFRQNNFAPWKDQSNVPGHVLYELM
ncbi:hypothetical protein FGO68_gene3957 [Halteria grandinella]|uniref:CHAP domain-containing protein n=1 Tax=Halteria grandinella TaxID=5974 RepID=A0A8J8SZ28_HALGN|nr:hypothetical protein FGO68_gene3957 [Halteria grandinella]